MKVQRRRGGGGGGGQFSRLHTMILQMQREFNDVDRGLQSRINAHDRRISNVEDTNGFNSPRTEEALRTAKLAEGKAERAISIVDRREEAVQALRNEVNELRSAIQLLQDLFDAWVDEEDVD